MPTRSLWFVLFNMDLFDLQGYGHCDILDEIPGWECKLNYNLGGGGGGGGLAA